MLRLVSASKSRLSGTWSDDDYDVFDDEQHIGRIVWSYAAPRERPWVWSITCRFPNANESRDGSQSRGSNGGVQGKVADINENPAAPEGDGSRQATN